MQAFIKAFFGLVDIAVDFVIQRAQSIKDGAGIFKTGDIAMEGPEFRKLTPSQLDEMLPRLTVLARSAPEDKYLLVTRLNGKNIAKNQAGELSSSC